MRKIVSPPKSSVPPSKTAASPSTPAGEDDNDIATMLGKSIEILRREIRHLMMESSQNKLNKGSATDLVQYIKLLTDLYEKEKELTTKLTDEELKELLHDDQAQPTGSGKGTEE